METKNDESFCCFRVFGERFRLVLETNRDIQWILKLLMGQLAPDRNQFVGFASKIQNNNF
jgi:hypothetical protein